MKKTTLLLMLAFPAAVAATAGDDCGKSADACAGGKTRTSPFAAASLAEIKPAPAKRPVEIKQGEAKKGPELKQAPAPKAPGTAPQPAAGEAKDTVAPEAEPAADPAAQARNELSSPLWLVFVGGSLAGLYFYLRGGRRKGGRK